MSWKISLAVEHILAKGRDGASLTRDDALLLMNLELESRETYALMECANHLSRTHFGTKGEKHLHIGLNVEPCPMDCSFCALTRRAGLFTEKIDFSMDQILTWARQGEAEGADALNLMSTGTFPFAGLLEIGRRLKREVQCPAGCQCPRYQPCRGRAAGRGRFRRFLSCGPAGRGQRHPL